MSNEARKQDRFQGKMVKYYVNGKPEIGVKKILYKKAMVFSVFVENLSSKEGHPCRLYSSGGKRIEDIETLQGDVIDGDSYFVAVQAGHRFNKADYEGFPEKRSRTQSSEPLTGQDLVAKNKEQYDVSSKAMGQYKQGINVGIYKNSDRFGRPHIINLKAKVIEKEDWSAVYQLINDMNFMQFPCKKLCTIKGAAVKKVSEMEKGVNYVAVGVSETFVQCAYGDADAGKESPRKRTSAEKPKEKKKVPAPYKKEEKKEKEEKKPEKKKRSVKKKAPKEDKKEEEVNGAENGIEKENTEESNSREESPRQHSAAGSRNSSAKEKDKQDDNSETESHRNSDENHKEEESGKEEDKYEENASDDNKDEENENQENGVEGDDDERSKDLEN